MDVTEQQIAAFLDPYRAFGRTKLAAEAAGEFLDGLGGGDDVVERGVQRFEALCRLRLRAARAAGTADSKTAGCNGGRAPRESAIIPARARLPARRTTTPS
jgi:hypothetical protein